MWKIQLFQLNYDELEKKAVSDVLDSGWITMGQNIIDFENKFAKLISDNVYCSAVSSGTAAMHLALIALNIKKGDEVIIPALTFVSDANCVKLVGADPVLADVTSEDNWNVSVETLEQVITKKTKAIVVVHYAGYPCDMKPIVELCKEKNIYLIEDCAHAPGASIDGIGVGSWGHVGCFSFFTNKNLSVGEGGMTSTKDKYLAKKIASLRSHGMTSLTLDRHKGRSTSYDVVEPGINYRMDEIRAALGLVQLTKLKKANLDRKKITDRYRTNFKNTNINVPFDKFCINHKSSYHILPILLPTNTDRGKLMEDLKNEGIQSSIHYPAFWDFEAYRNQFDKKLLPNAANIIPRELTLPLYPSMSNSEIDIVSNAVINNI